MRISAPLGGGSRVSMSLTGWLVAIVVLSPFILGWFLVKAIAVLVQLGIDAHRAVHAAPVLPPRLKPPPRR